MAKCPICERRANLKPIIAKEKNLQICNECAARITGIKDQISLNANFNTDSMLALLSANETYNSLSDFGKEVAEKYTKIYAKMKEASTQKSVPIFYKGYGMARYTLEGDTGKTLRVFDDFLMISTKLTIGSVVTGNATDGEKIIFYRDIIGLQSYGTSSGYLQFETASSLMNNEKSNLYNENTFVYSGINEMLISDVQDFVFRKVYEYKTGKEFNPLEE